MVIKAILVNKCFVVLIEKHVTTISDIVRFINKTMKKYRYSV